MIPEEMIGSVNSREAFLHFLAALIADCANPNDWENTSLEGFLEAMHAWAIDSQMLKDESSWRDFAQLLLAGKGYE
jgi:hypothetical protein